MIDYNAIRSSLFQEFDDRCVRCAGPEDRKKNLCWLFKSFASLIEDFFRDRDMKDKTSQMYAGLRFVQSSPIRNTSIEIVDVSVSASVYQDYLGGMQSFIQSVISDSSTSGTEKYSSDIALAEEKDGEFISTVFGGANSPIVKKPLTDAVSNVEYLVDFHKCLCELISKTEEIYASARPVYGDPNVRRCLNIMSRSSAEFSNNLIKEAFKTFDMILDSLDGSPYSHGGARNYTEPKEQFKLF